MDADSENDSDVLQPSAARKRTVATTPDDDSITPDSDPFNLQRFLDAQSDVFDDVLAELRDGDKSSCWMWFVFPQIKGLGSSPNAKYFSLSGAEESRAYLDHPILGPRLLECAGLVASIQNRTAIEIFGGLDALKLRSSLTLFWRVAPELTVFRDCLVKYYEGEADRKTEEILLSGDDSEDEDEGSDDDEDDSDSEQRSARVHTDGSTEEEENDNHNT